MTTEENNNVGVITKTPNKVSEKIKDPKRVQAGKKLAEYNKKAKEDKKKVNVVEEEEEEEERESFGDHPSQISLSQISILLGIGLTMINVFIGYKQLNPQIKKPSLEKEEKVIEKPKQVILGME